MKKYTHHWTHIAAKLEPQLTLLRVKYRASVTNTCYIEIVEQLDRFIHFLNLELITDRCESFFATSNEHNPT